MEDTIDKNSVQSIKSKEFATKIQCKHEEHDTENQRWCIKCDSKLTDLQNSLVEFVDEGIKIDSSTGMIICCIFISLVGLFFLL